MIDFAVISGGDGSDVAAAGGMTAAFANNGTARGAGSDVSIGGFSVDFAAAIAIGGAGVGPGAALGTGFGDGDSVDAEA